MNIIEKHIEELENKIYGQLNATEEILYKWEHDTYPMDPNTIAAIWDDIDNAPAIRIIGDYDVDGQCAVYILAKSIKSKYPKKSVSIRIPHRFSEGYGINTVIADEIIRSMPKNSVIITVDNGIASSEILERLENMGYIVIMTDHHALRDGNKIPDVTMVIDPEVEEIDNPLDGKYWCGAGIAYKICEPIIDEKLRHDLSIYAAIATVADCVPLVEGNWGLVKRAIQAFRNNTAPIALNNLLIELGKDPNFCNEEYFGYYLGPAINAPGRLLDDGANLVIRYLNKGNPEDRKKIKQYNDDRKKLKEEQYNQVKEYIESKGLQNSCPIWVCMPSLHEGIIGILAGEVVKEYGKPAIILTNEQGKIDSYKGSGRTAGDFNLFEYLKNIPNECFIKLGGHPGAAGMSMTWDGFNEAKKYQIPDFNINKEQTKAIKMLINAWEIPDIASTLDKFRPFGEGNPVPIFETIIDMEKDNVIFLGDKKQHLFVKDKYNRYEITHFYHEPNDLSDKRHFKLEGTINRNAFRGLETPALNATKAIDIIEDKEKEKDLL